MSISSELESYLVNFYMHMLHVTTWECNTRLEPNNYFTLLSVDVKTGCRDRWLPYKCSVSCLTGLMLLFRRPYGRSSLSALSLPLPTD